MSPKTISLLAVLVVCVYPATASTYYVGPCKSNSYSTISAAVTAVPPGSTIMICPGTYIEQQIIISKDLTLKGMDGSAADGGDGAQIYAYSPPQTTSSVVFTYLLYELRGAITPIIWVTGGTVNIQNISVYSEADQGPFCPGPTTVGFFYASGTSGTLNHVGYFSLGNDCQIGILAENGTATPTAFTVENSFSTAGIVAGSSDSLGNATLRVKIVGNQVLLVKPYEELDIYLYGVSGTVETNYISGSNNDDNSSTAIIVDGEPYPTDVTVSGNTIQTGNNFLQDKAPYDTGIYVNVDGVTVKGNKISGPAYGILACNAGTVSGNTISFTLYGISAPAGSIGANTFYNTASKTSTC